MPVYEYECTRCSLEFEEERPISAPPRQRCPQCRGKVRKLISRPAIVFKGSGFYATDSRRSGPGGEKPCPEAVESGGEACAACEHKGPAKKNKKSQVA